MLDVLRAQVPRGGLEEHGLVEAAPDVLRRVDEVLDAAGNAVDVEPRGVVAARAPRRGGGGGGGGFGGEGQDGGLDRGHVPGDGLAGGLHEHDRVGGVDEVAVPGADQLPELLLLVLDLPPRRGLRAADLRDGLRPEQGLGVLVAALRRRGRRRRRRRLDPHRRWRWWFPAPADQSGGAGSPPKRSFRGSAALAIREGGTDGPDLEREGGRGRDGERKRGKTEKKEREVGLKLNRSTWEGGGGRRTWPLTRRRC